MSKEELEKKFKLIFPNGTKEQLEAFVKANSETVVVPSNVCSIDDPDCLSCGS